ncbi:MAG: ATP-binding protein [Oligoflexales bacterium]
MKRPKLFWQIFPPVLWVCILSMGIAISVTFREFYDSYHKKVVSQLQTDGSLVIDRVVQGVMSGNYSLVQSLAEDFARKTLARFTVILPDGTVIADSHENPGKMVPHNQRFEIAKALKGEIGSVTRFSDTLQEEYIYVAVPLKVDQDIIGVLRIAQPFAVLRAFAWNTFQSTAIVCLVFLFSAAGVCVYLSRKIMRPVSLMAEHVRQIAEGKTPPTFRLDPDDSKEIAALGANVNQMVFHLQERLLNVAEHQKELETLLASMIEGVVAIGHELEVKYLNRAACNILNIDPSLTGTAFPLESVGQLSQLVRASSVVEFASNFLAGTGPNEKETTLFTPFEKTVQLRANVFFDQLGYKSMVLILHDVTDTKKLEEFRKQFVANVSHELKTPLTSIAGFTEMLLSGRIESEEQKTEFLTIIDKHAKKLSAIIADLLSLSYLENNEDRIKLARMALRPLLEASVETCQFHAQNAGVDITLECPDDIHVNANETLFEQAIINLIDNAIKYGGTGGKVVVSAEARKPFVTLKVRDYGKGIAPEHLHRLFERFYRVDESRGRDQGGTGLGLAIVKHIVLAHKGQIQVESQPEKGSCFTISLKLS